MRPAWVDTRRRCLILDWSSEVEYIKTQSPDGPLCAPPQTAIAISSSQSPRHPHSGGVHRVVAGRLDRHQECCWVGGADAPRVGVRLDPECGCSQVAYIKTQCPDAGACFPGNHRHACSHDDQVAPLSPPAHPRPSRITHRTRSPLPSWPATGNTQSAGASERPSPPAHPR